jgi:hypothetical protein
MLAVEDCYAYWQQADTSIPHGDRARVAFDRRWFGAKSEARVRTIITDMVERFDAYPQALALLQRLGSVASELRPFICHLHTQLADPIYRKFTGEFLPARREAGHASIDRDAVARWADSLDPGRWSATTCIKFGSNLLATAFDAGLVGARRDPRKLTVPHVPELFVGYALYLLRDTQLQGTLTDNPYLRSLGLTPDSFRLLAPRLPDVNVAELGGAMELTWLQPDLMSWGLKNLRAA